MLKGKKMTEQDYEKLLNIETSKEQKDFHESLHYNRYEATPYSALNMFFKEYTVSEKDSVIDYGCGKGRLLFYINHFFNSKVTGIEMDKGFYEDCLNNKASYLCKHKISSDKISFINNFAQNYAINDEDNKFYFFNPFSVQIFMKIIDNILDSIEKNNRAVEIILYYPSDDYIYYLEACTAFELVGEVRIDKLYAKDSRERFLVYRLDFSF